MLTLLIVPLRRPLLEFILSAKTTTKATKEKGVKLAVVSATFRQPSIPPILPMLLKRNQWYRCALIQEEEDLWIVTEKRGRLIEREGEKPLEFLSNKTNKREKENLKKKKDEIKRRK